MNEIQLKTTSMSINIDLPSFVVSTLKTKGRHLKLQAPKSKSTSSIINANEYVAKKYITKYMFFRKNGVWSFVELDDETHKKKIGGNIVDFVKSQYEVSEFDEVCNIIDELKREFLKKSQTELELQAIEHAGTIHNNQSKTRVMLDLMSKKYDDLLINLLNFNKFAPKSNFFLARKYAIDVAKPVEDARSIQIITFNNQEEQIAEIIDVIPLDDFIGFDYLMNDLIAEYANLHYGSSTNLFTIKKERVMDAIQLYLQDHEFEIYEVIGESSRIFFDERILKLNPHQDNLDLLLRTFAVCTTYSDVRSSCISYMLCKLFDYNDDNLFESAYEYFMRATKDEMVTYLNRLYNLYDEVLKELIKYCDEVE